VSPVRRCVNILASAAAVVIVVIAAVVVQALRVSGTDGVEAKLAEWGRDHGLSREITLLERIQYDEDPPAVGGSPPGGIAVPGGAVTRALPSTALDPAPLAVLAPGARLPNEGMWQTVVTVHGGPAVQVAELRPDASHTSFVAGVMRMDPKLIRGELRPGTRDPGGNWKAATYLTTPELRTVAAVFNGGFRLNDPSHGGYYSDGRTVVPLLDGEASLVLHADGTADVGTWNDEVRMDPTVASVRQNLVPLVDGGEVNPSCATGGQKEWGNTVGQAAFIQRSGFGVTATGVEVYVAGPALSVCSLGRIMADAGVVRGMELDINPAWVSGAYFPNTMGDQSSGPPKGFRLYPAERVDPQHYLRSSSRDWLAWFTRT
jgi:hypothetical protein